MSTKIKTVRLAIPPNFEKVLDFLRQRFQTLSDAEIFKFAINELYHQEIKNKNDDNWPNLAASSPSFDFLKDAAEDIYT